MPGGHFRVPHFKNAVYAVKRIPSDGENVYRLFYGICSDRFGYGKMFFKGKFKNKDVFPFRKYICFRPAFI